MKLVVYDDFFYYSYWLNHYNFVSLWFLRMEESMQAVWLMTPHTIQILIIA